MTGVPTAQVLHHNLRHKLHNPLGKFYINAGRRESKMNAMKRLGICLAIFATFRVAFSDHEVEGICLEEKRHKPKPTPEDDSFKACHVFKESSCCTSEFANQLVGPVVQKVGNFSWTLCGNLSKRCQDFMVGVECFYSCSPYVGLWADPNYKASFKNAPVCSDYCDNWFDACKNDLSCARNWIFDFNVSADGHNTCKRNCTTFGDLYKDGKDLCETMWNKSFNYTKDEDRCLHFRYNEQHNPNKDVVQKIFGHSGSVATRSSVLVLTFFMLFNLLYCQ